MIFFSKLKVLQVSLLEELITTTEILQFVKAVDCYLNCLYCILDSLHYSNNSGIS